MRPKAPIWAVIAGLTLAGCGSSPPSRFYTLASVPPAARSPPHETPARSLMLGKLTVPSILDRPEIAVRMTATQLEFSETRRWAAPLDTLVRRTLADDLSARLGDPALLANGAAIAVVNVDISEFDADRAGEVTLDARWTVAPRSHEALPISSEHARLQVPPTGDDAGDVAATMSQALGMLADRIIARLVSAPRSQAPD